MCIPVAIASEFLRRGPPVTRLTGLGGGRFCLLVLHFEVIDDVVAGEAGEGPGEDEGSETGPGEYVVGGVEEGEHVEGRSQIGGLEVGGS